jgi:hypothetical protein
MTSRPAAPLAGGALDAKRDGLAQLARRGIEASDH